MPSAPRNFWLGGLVRPVRILYIYANAVGLADLKRFGRIQKWKRPDQYILDVAHDQDLDKVVEYVTGEIENGGLTPAEIKSARFIS